MARRQKPITPAEKEKRKIELIDGYWRRGYSKWKAQHLLNFYLMVIGEVTEEEINHRYILLDEDLKERKKTWAGKRKAAQKRTKGGTERKAAAAELTDHCPPGEGHLERCLAYVRKRGGVDEKTLDEIKACIEECHREEVCRYNKGSIKMRLICLLAGAHHRETVRG